MIVYLRTTSVSWEEEEKQAHLHFHAQSLLNPASLLFSAPIQ